MSHIEMMQLAQKNARYGDCVERQVGAVAVFANGDVISSCNSAAWDSTNDNHAESKLVVMAGLMRKDLSGATLYTTCRPCARCTEMLLPLGLRAIYYRDDQPEMGHLQALRDSGVLVDGCWIQGQVADMWAERNGGGGMIKLELTTQQLDDLLQLNHTYIDVPASAAVYRGDTVEAADRLCHVTAVSDNRFCKTKRLSLRVGGADKATQVSQQTEGQNHV